MSLTSAWEAEVEEPEASEEARGVHVLPRREPQPHHPSPTRTWVRRIAWLVFGGVIGFVVYLVITG